MRIDSITRRIPGVAVSNQKILNGIKWIGKNMSSPEQRLILGVSALMSQPFIDLYNKYVDEDTRKISALRTIAKIIAGTLTGVLIRAGCIKLIDKFAKMPHEIKPGMSKKWATLLTPDLNKLNLKDLTQYKYALGTIISLIVMIFTNFAIDAPLTKFLTNKFIDKSKISLKNSSQNSDSNKFAKSGGVNG